jgi:hypothetical protein
MAVNCCCTPATTDGDAGLMAIDWSAAGVTVTVVLPLTTGVVVDAALTVADPTLTPVATPWLPFALLTVTAGDDDDHDTRLVRSWVLPSL